MPLYEYECNKCGNIVTDLHAHNETPEIICNQCSSSDFTRLMSTYNFKMGRTNAQRKWISKSEKQKEMKADLKENYGVEKVKPIANKSFEQVYENVKEAGSSVKDSMQQTREQNKKRMKDKQKEWMKGALKRTPERAKLIREKNAEEDYNKRKIDIQGKDKE